MAVLVGADAAVREALSEVARLFGGPGVSGHCMLGVPETLWERVVEGAEATWDWEEIHDGRLGWGHEWLVQVGETLCMMHGIRATSDTYDQLGVSAMGLVAGSDELVDYVVVAVAPEDTRAGCGELYRALRDGGLAVEDSVSVAMLMS
jgi:hypothetical protein